MDSMTLDWMAVILVLVVAGVLLYQLLTLVPREWVVRCPEQGVITFVEVKSAPSGDAHPSGVTVHHCGLWGAKKNCGQGCLVRYHQAPRGLFIDRNALRTYDH